MAFVPARQVVLAPYSSLQTGGPADYFAVVDSLSQLVAGVQFAQDNQLPLTILGGGSNVLINDNGVPGLTLHMAMRGIHAEVHDESVLLHVAAGELFDDVVAYAVAHGYWGLENLSHIPGTAGATPVQNVGAYGVEVKDLITAVTVYDTAAHTSIELTAQQCAFSYRDSIFKHATETQYIVTAVTYKLDTKPNPQLSYKDLALHFGNETPTLAAIREAVIMIRSQKFPDWHTVGTAGSFFKNPVITAEQFVALQSKYPDVPHFVAGDGLVKVPLGWILDKVLQLRGTGTEFVGSYQGQALVLINKGGASSAMIAAFANDIVARVLATTEITIEWEVTRLG